jgi:hypothetical protein
MKDIKDKTIEIKQTSKEKIHNKVKTHRKFLIRLADYTTAHVWRSIIITIISSFVSKPVFLIFSTILALYAFIIALALFRHGLKYLFNNQGNIYELIIGYALAVIGIIFFFTTVYSISEELHTGYLTYGTCSDMDVDDGVISNDPNTVQSFSGRFYFSAVTFFTIGYGDICPMGLNKGISLINGFFGSVFATIILAIAIAKYLEKDRDNKRGNI